MAKSVAQQIEGRIKQEERKLQEIEQLIESYWDKVRELRNMIYTLQQGEPHPDNPVKIADLQRQVQYYESLAEQVSVTERHNQLYKLGILKENAVRLRYLLQHNKTILVTKRQEVQVAKLRAAKMVEDAEQTVLDTQCMIDIQEKELLILEGGE
ncbi:hypothetical protein P9314_08225 [Paenibacillus validus]|uniref:hypothetical protein n=1 Tax=Paenibacillus TaxID=44249 RepID=UPI000FDCAE64|nr:MULTISPECIES: hypothetical protein [Paenibacillus]MED4600688.1 hypothetical protein [Paenibacillus validus]MED4605327.1 hypothetical protein [Paenibacillus validus]